MPNYDKGLNTDRSMNKGIKNIYHNKRILLSESFDMNFPIRSNHSESDDDNESDKWLHSDIKPHQEFEGQMKDKDIIMDEDLSIIKLKIDDKINNPELRSKTCTNFEMIIGEDSISQIISDSFLDEIKSDDEEMNESEREIEEWNRQIKLIHITQARRATYQEPKKNKLEISSTPRYSEHDVYYIFQYHYIEHPIDWLFISEEPYILIDLVNDQQIIYANQTLSLIIDKMPEQEIMP